MLENDTKVSSGRVFYTFFIDFVTILEDEPKKNTQQIENILRIFRALPKQIYAHAVRRRCHALRVQSGAAPCVRHAVTKYPCSM